MDASRTRPRPVLVVTLLATLLALTPPAAAQTVSLRAGWERGAPGARWAVAGVPRDGGTVGFAAVLSPTPGLDLEVRGAQAFGALGTLTVEADGALRALPQVRARANVGARGAFGPIAGRLEARAWGAPAERFEAYEDPGPARASRGASLLASVEGRLDRTWLLGGAVRTERGAAGAWTLDGRVEARARRLFGPTLDLEMRAHTRVAGEGDGRAGLGAGFTHAPRRAPEVDVLAFVDVAPAADGVRIAPGLETAGARDALGGRLGWTVRLRPLAPQRAPLWASLTWSRPQGEGTLRLRTSLAHGGAAGSEASVSAAYERNVDLR